MDRRERFCPECHRYLGWDADQASDSQVFRGPGPQRDEQRAGLTLQLEDDRLDVAPGGAESTTFTVRNLGTKVEQFRLLVTGPPWLRAEPAAMSVFPGQEATGTLQAAPPRSPAVVAGTWPFQLSATSTLHAQVSAGASGAIGVAPYYELAAELDPGTISARGLTTHVVRLDNRGNAPLRIPLHPADVADGLRVGVPAYADTWPGRVTEVPVPVRAGRRWFGRPEPRSFAVIVEPPKPLAATRLPATRIVPALLPGWVPAAAGLAAVGLGVAAAVVVPRLTVHPLPSPTSTATASATTASSQAAPTTAPVTTASSPATTASGASVSTSSTTQASTVSTAPTTPASPPVSSPSLPAAVDFTATAASAVWHSGSSAGQFAVAVRSGSGCQTGFESAGNGSVFELSDVGLSDGTLASAALETDPPTNEDGNIVGDYTFPATGDGERFRAEVGFCQGEPSGAAMYYEVDTESGTQLANGTISPNDSALAAVDVQLDAGTTQLVLLVRNTEDQGTQYGDVVWVDPRVEAAAAPSPPPRPAAPIPTATPSPS